MSRFSLLKFFPPPDYLALPAVGIDISDQSIKFTKLKRTHHGLRLGDYGEAPVPFGAIQSGEIKKAEAVTAVLAELKRAHKLEAIVASLPEEAAYVIRLQLPVMKKSDLRESIELQLEEHVPVPPAEAIFDYEILHEPGREGDMFDLVVNVFPKRIVLAYTNVFLAAGLLPLALEIEAQAIARSVVLAKTATHTLIVDFGKTRISFFVNQGVRVLFTTTIGSIGGENITKAIERGLKVSYEEAEKLKIERGLLPDKDNQELFFAVMPVASAVRDEITKQIDYWLSHSEHPPIEQIILCGGQATLPGLVDYLNMSLAVPVVLGNSWTNVFSLDDFIPPLNLNQSLRYTTSLGLSLRHLP
ncbi:MAG: type IV pilus assembly protein PilM [Patescibacteria group bacterium]